MLRDYLISCYAMFYVEHEINILLDINTLFNKVIMYSAETSVIYQQINGDNKKGNNNRAANALTNAAVSANIDARLDAPLTALLDVPPVVDSQTFQ